MWKDPLDASYTVGICHLEGRNNTTMLLSLVGICFHKTSPSSGLSTPKAASDFEAHKASRGETVDVIAL